MSTQNYIFAFGSLVRLADVARFLERPDLAPDEAVICRLRDHRRVWNVARDNMQDYPDRPHYLCAATGVRLNIFVTFLNIRPQTGHIANGVALRVDEEGLERLDKREALYDRTDVTDLIEGIPSGRVWVYRGHDAARACYQEGLAAGRACINATYLESVIAGFAELGTGHLADYFSSSDAPEVPLRSLVRVKI